MSTRVINLTQKLMILQDRNVDDEVYGTIEYELRFDRDRIVSSDKFTKKVRNQRKIMKIHIRNSKDDDNNHPLLVLDPFDFEDYEAIVIRMDEKGEIYAKVVERKDKGSFAAEIRSWLTCGDRPKREALIAAAKPMNPRTSS